MAAGLVPKQALRTASYRRLFADCYADSALTVDHALRARAVALLLPPHSAPCGWSAAAVHGVAWVEAGADVVVRTPHGSAWGPVAGVTIVKRATHPLATTTIGGARVELRDEVVFSLASRLVDATDAVPLVDAALARWPVLARQVPQLLDTWAGRRDVVRARAVLALADGRSESPAESRLRDQIIRAGIPAPVPQHTIRTGTGGFVARVDLAWPAHRVAVEYDGAWHNRSDEQFRADRARSNRVVDSGWTILSVTRDVSRGPRAEGLFRQLGGLLERTAPAGAGGPGG